VKKLPYVLITRRRPVREHERAARLMRNEYLAEKPSFELFETEVPETTGLSHIQQQMGGQRRTAAQPFGTGDQGGA
jgi:chromosome partitioning protein